MTEADWLACTDPQRMLEWITVFCASDRWALTNAARDRKLRLFACACCRSSATTSERNNQVHSVAEYFADGKASAEDFARAVYASVVWPNQPVTAHATVMGIIVAEPTSFMLDSVNTLPAPTASILRHIIGPTPWRPVWSRKCQRCEGKGSIRGWECKCCSRRGLVPIQPCVAKSPADPKVLCNSGSVLHWAEHDPFERGKTEWKPCQHCDRGCSRPDLSAAVVSLAEAVYRQEAGASEALHDELLECGMEELAAHFKAANLCPVSFPHLPHDYCDGTPAPHDGCESHPPGCWAIDAILGKE